MYDEESYNKKLQFRTHDSKLGYYYEARGHSLYVYRNRIDRCGEPIFTSPVNIYSAFHSVEGKYLIVNHGSGSWGNVSVIFQGDLADQKQSITEEEYRRIVSDGLKELYPEYAPGRVLHLYAPIREVKGDVAILYASGDFYWPKSEGGYGQIQFESRFFQIDLAQKTIKVLDHAEGLLSWVRGNPDRDASLGSGFFITKSHVITNAHVVGDATRVCIALGNREAYARVNCVSKRFDLALLEIRENALNPGPISLASTVRLGSRIRVFGYPLPIHQGFSLKVTDGLISGLFGLEDDPLRFQMSAPIQPGNSGGAVVNEMGKVVGVAVASLDKISTAKQVGVLPENVNLAVHLDILRYFLESQKIELPFPDSQPFNPEESCVQIIRTHGWGAR